MGGYTGFSRFQKYNYIFVILIKKIDKDGGKYVGYAQNAVNCGVECVYFATHTIHILKDLDFSPFSQSTDREYLFPNSCRNSQIPYGIVAHEQFSLSISHANL